MKLHDRQNARPRLGCAVDGKPDAPLTPRSLSSRVPPMNTVLWILQVLLAAAMFAAGSMKLVRTKQQLLASGRMDWARRFAPSSIKGIGALEVLAAIGLTIPATIGVAPVLAAFAATGVVALMVGAAITHVRDGETATVPVNFVLGGLALFVAIERFGPYAF